MGTDAFEPAVVKEQPETSIVLDLAGVGVSLMNSKLVEVIYLTLAGFKLDYSMNATFQSLTWTVETMQLDNQLYDAIYPVVIQPTPIPQGVKKNGVPPCIQLSVILLNDERMYTLVLLGHINSLLVEHGVTFIKYASLLLQALTIQVDEDFLFAVIDMSNLKSLSWDVEASEE